MAKLVGGGSDINGASPSIFSSFQLIFVLLLVLGNDNSGIQPNFDRSSTSLNLSCVTCHVSLVICHMSRFMCHVSHVKKKKGKRG